MLFDIMGDEIRFRGIPVAAFTGGNPSLRSEAKEAILYNKDPDQVNDEINKAEDAAEAVGYKAATDECVNNLSTILDAIQNAKKTLDNLTKHVETIIKELRED